jgi:hypothetical protein
MAQMRRVDLSSIGFLFIGALCGALLIFGLSTLRHQTPSATTSMVFVTSSSELAPPLGGRLGGIASSDTATDWITHQALGASNDVVLGGRLGGITSADMANDVMVKLGLQRIVGLGEGLRVQPDTTHDTINVNQRAEGPGEGIIQFIDTTSYGGSTAQRIIGPGEGLNRAP